MRQTSLRNWGQPQSQGYYFDSEDEGLDIGDELGDFGKPVEDESHIFKVLSDLIIKLAMLVLLMLCIAAMGFCVYRLATNFKPLLQKAICEAPAAALEAKR